MSLKFEFDSFRGASEFGKNLSRNLGVTSRHERGESKHIIVIPEKNLNGVAATALAVSVVTAGLISGQHYLDEERFAMVISAMQRANPDLSSMTLTDIGDYLSNLSPDQLQGVVSNTKGVYHEMLYVDSFSVSGSESEVALHTNINNPGSDVVFYSDGEITKEVQLKATDSASYVNDHFEKYPNIDVVATDEVASKMDGVESSGFTNSILEQDVSSSFDQLISSSDIPEVVTETLSSSVVEETFGIGPISIITGLLFGIF